MDDYTVMEHPPDNPYASPQSYSQDSVSGWIKHIRVVSVLLVVQGTLEIWWSLLLLVRWQPSVTSYVFIAIVAAIGVLKINAGAGIFTTTRVFEA